uniref:PHD-type domain-containing protein n=1 Tax=Leersia perrieri TaxID=77586 RepID=A0A0D9UY56_9ORYZ
MSAGHPSCCLLCSPSRVEEVSNVQENNDAGVDNSSEESEDVKVCDICGDVGVEKKLAICNRCNDGAEHIYCMMVMIPEVPEGDWLCEECQTEIQIKKENNTLEDSQDKVSTISIRDKVKAANVGNEEFKEEDKGNHTSRKRTKEDAGIIDEAEPGTVNVCCLPCVHPNCPSFPTGLEERIVPSTSNKTVKEEDGSSCIGGSGTANKTEAGYGHQQTSDGINNISNLKLQDGERHNLQSHSNDVPRTSEVHGLSGMTLKNKSSKMSEIKRSEEVVDVKVCDICGDVGAEEKLAVCSRCSDGAEHIYCMRVMMQEVPKAEWLCETCHYEVECEKGKTKVQTSDLKVGCSKGQSIVEPMEKLVNTTKGRSSSETAVDAENVGSKVSDSGNEMNGANKRKDGDAGITSLARKDPLSRESSFKLYSNKVKDPAAQVSTSLACNSLRNQMAPLRGQLSKSTSFNSSKIPKVKQLNDEIPQKPKTLKDSLSCPMRKEGPMGILAKSASFKKPKSLDLVNKAKPSTVINPSVSGNARNDILTSILGSRSLTGSVAVPVPSKAQASAQHLNKGNTMANSNILGTCVESAKSSLGHSDVKKPLHAKGYANIKLTSADGSLGMLSPGAQRKTILVPDFSHQDDQMKNPPSLVPNSFSSVRTNEQDTRYNWSIPCNASFRDPQTVSSMRGRGGFQLWRTGRYPVLCEGLQSHLSYVASPKVLEVTKKFPSNIQLEELPRQNVWPPHFHENGPTVDSIGLFFFASDTQSYETHYSKLVENMVKDDLALRGNIETTELLIFASNTLPNNFQKWNLFHFLWGVFRVRRKDTLNLPPDLPTHDDNHGCPNGVKTLFHPVGGKPLEGHSNDSITTRFPTNNSGAINDYLPAPTRKNLKLANSEQKDKMKDSSKDNGFDVNMELNNSIVSLVREKGNKTRNIKTDNAEHLIDGGNVNSTQVSFSNMETISHVTRAVPKRNAEVANLDDKVNGRPEHKKIKLGDGGSGCPG